MGPSVAVGHALLAAVEVNAGSGSGSGTTILLVITAIVGSGGILGAVVAFFKLRPEKDSIVVTTAQGALLMQTGISAELRKDNERLKERVHELEQRVADRDATIRTLRGGTTT